MKGEATVQMNLGNFTQNIGEIDTIELKMIERVEIIDGDYRVVVKEGTKISKSLPPQLNKGNIYRIFDFSKEI